MAFDDPASSGGTDQKTLKDWLVVGLRKAAENVIGYPTPEDQARTERLKDPGIMYQYSEQGKQDRQDEAMRMASSFAPGHIGGAGIIRDVYHATPRDYSKIDVLRSKDDPVSQYHKLGPGDTGMWWGDQPHMSYAQRIRNPNDPDHWITPSTQPPFDRYSKPSEIKELRRLNEEAKKAGHIWTADLRWPDIVKESRDPLGYKHFKDKEDGGWLDEVPEGSSTGHHGIWQPYGSDPSKAQHDVSIMDESLLHNVRKQSTPEFLAAQEDKKQNIFSTPEGRKYQFMEDPDRPVRLSERATGYPALQGNVIAKDLSAHPNAEPIAYLSLLRTLKKGPIISQDTAVQGDWQGQGVARNMYDFIQNKWGRMEPDRLLTRAGQNFWAKYDPALLRKSMIDPLLEDMPEMTRQSGSQKEYAQSRLEDMLYRYGDSRAAPIAKAEYDHFMKLLRNQK